jgi:hypothetical protein
VTGWVWVVVGCDGKSGVTAKFWGSFCHFFVTSK